MALTSRSTTGTNSRTDPTSTPSSGCWTQTGPAAAFFHFQLSGVRTPGEGTVPTAHRLTHESRFRPGPPTRCPPHFPYGPAFQEGAEPADRPVRAPSLQRTAQPTSHTVGRVTRPGVPRIFPTARHFKKAPNLQIARRWVPISEHDRTRHLIGLHPGVPPQTPPNLSTS